MDQLDRYKLRLEADFPELDVQSATVLSGGMDHAAIEVGGLIFRLPKEQVRGLRVSAEVAILQRLQGKLPVNIPNPTHIAPGGGYFGYQKLAGMIAAERPEITQTDAYIAQWVKIVQAIHESLSVDEAYALGLPQFDPLTHFGYYERVVALSDYPDTNDGIRRFARRTLDRVQAIDLKDREQLFVHNDFHAKNVVLNPETLRISGLIDWSDMVVGPLELEFWVWEWDSPEYLEQAATLYTERTGRPIRLDEARTWLHLGELADYYNALITNDEQEASEVLSHINRWISEGK